MPTLKVFAIAIQIGAVLFYTKNFLAKGKNGIQFMRLNLQTSNPKFYHTLIFIAKIVALKPFSEIGCFRMKLNHCRNFSQRKVDKKMERMKTIQLSNPLKSRYCMKHFILFTILIFTVATTVLAQIKTPQLSPSCKLTQEVGLIKVDIDYSRPSAKGRKIFGDLVPYGLLWRTGANASTKVTFSDDVIVGGVALKKGTYALYTIPEEKDWSIVFYQNYQYLGRTRSVGLQRGGGCRQIYGYGCSASRPG